MIEAAAVYLILRFPGQSGEALILPLANMELCQMQGIALSEKYNADMKTPLKVFTYCIDSGLASKKNSK